MSIKIELGFTELGVGAPFFTIGDATKGVIGGSYTIGGGEGLVDVTEHLTSVSVRRGKSRELDRFDAGQIAATFNNNLRAFDPTYEGSPYYGQIVPKRTIKLTVDDEVSFLGTVEDWNIEYSPSGVSTASCVGFDGFSALSNLTLTGYSPSEELSGARVEGVLDEIEWPADKRDIDTGQETLVAGAVADNTNAVEYLTKIEQSENGWLFVSKSGDIKFIDRISGFGTSPVAFSDDGTEIDYQGINVVYGSELLYNRVVLTGSAGTAISEDEQSQALYGIRELNRDSLISSLSPMESIADSLVIQYREPEYRFNSIQIVLESLDAGEKAELLGLELGDVVQVKFTPSGIPPQIAKFGRVISIEQSFEPQQSSVSLGLQSLDGSPFVIGSSAFGIIGQGIISF